MMYPNLVINKAALLHNLCTLKQMAHRSGVSLSIVTKGLVGHEPLVRLLAGHGADSICEAHIQSLVKFKDIPAEKWLIRSPLISEAAETVQYADISLISEISVLQSLSDAAVRQGCTHKAVITLELGDLREGCMPHELLSVCEACTALPGITLHGIGANLSCASEVVPDDENMAMLANAATEIESALGVKLPLVSGGSSSAIKMLEEGRLPKAINHLRIGEAILLGNIVCYDIPYEGARTDAFTLNAEIIEVKEKPSRPWGKYAAGTPYPEASPTAPMAQEAHLRALVAIGKQDIHAKDLIPLDPELKILTDTSDCTICDVTVCAKKYKPGDLLSFRLRYNGLVSAMASNFVEKILV